MNASATGRREAIREIVAPAFRALVDEVIPLGQSARAVAARNGIDPDDQTRSLLGKTSSQVRYLNRLRSSETQQPSAAKAWDVGDIAFALGAGHNWCASLLFVFAAGHLDVFARTIASTDEVLVPRDRKTALVLAARTACNPTPVTSGDELRDRLRARKIPDTLIQVELRKKREGSSQAVRPDRDTWKLTDVERPAIHAAFLQPASTLGHGYQVAVETCRLAAENPGVGIQMQRDIAVTALWHTFGS
jgi:hypothetical protein